MSLQRTRHREQIRKCVAEMDLLLPQLASRHPPLVVLVALTEHIGDSLYRSQDSLACSPEEARDIIASITRLAFPPSE